MQRADDVTGMRLDTPLTIFYRHDMTQGRDTAGRRFAALIKSARLAKKLTQEQLGLRVGADRQTILRYESGNAVNPDPKQVRAVCLALGIDPREPCIALGYFTRAEMELPAPRTTEDASIDEVIEILRDPEVPADQKAAWVNYLRYLREQRTDTSQAG
jgi:transcriptional regulator with XRE-family HTH domain